MSALLGAGIGALAAELLAVRRRRNPSATELIAEAEVSLPEQPAEPPELSAGPLTVIPTPPADRPRLPTRVWSLFRRGFDSSVAWLFVGGSLILGCGWLIQPDDSVPNIPNPVVELQFSGDHQARSAIRVDLYLTRDGSLNGDGHQGSSLLIDIRGDDLRQPGWTVQAVVPRGVRVNGATDNNDIVQGRVDQFGETDEDLVIFQPGPEPSGRFGPLLIWDGDVHGPVQVEGANLVAAFPAVVVSSYRKPDSDDSTSPPKPEVSVSYFLSPSSDFAFVAGPQPDTSQKYLWTWAPQTGQVGPGEVGVPPTIEAHSVSIDAKLHNHEFTGGILYGVGASAIVAGIQEWLTNRRRSRDLA
jgi:hypothetical protein